MPLPALAIPAIIAAGANLAGQGANFLSNRANNRANERMYERQRQDSLADFAMMNEYNHPSSQMARLREAGLNPNLVYGNGQATTTAAPIRTANVGNFKPAQFDGGSVMASFVNTALGTAQADNLRAQNTVILQEQFLKAAQVMETIARTENTVQNTNRSRFDLSQLQQLSQTNMDLVKESLRTQQINNQVTLDKNSRENEMQIHNVRNAIEQTKNSQQSREESAQRIAEGLARLARLNFDLEQDKKYRPIEREQQLGIESYKAGILSMDMNLKQLDEQLKQIELEISKMGGTNPYIKSLIQALLNRVSGGRR
ncbi:DNA pilot protein [Tortoise microvirus 91]|nr:DNA pilot protein [Tortoise microvirus 91]